MPGYGRLWASGLFWNLTRWMSIFVCTYMVNRITGSPLLVQLVGSALFIPMFVGGALGGVLSDRFDRKRSILFQLVMLAPCALLMGLVVLSGAERAWMVYPFILLIGIGQMVDMTVRRAMIFDFVGESRVTNALAIEALSMTGGNMLGGVSAGATVSLLGIGETFLIISACYVVAYLLLVGVSTPRREVPVSTKKLSIVSDLAAGFRYVGGHPTLISLLGVTALMNLFYFSFIPMVPVFAERLEVNALLAGVLAGSNAFGSMIGTLAIARGMRFGRGAIYVGGSFVDARVHARVRGVELIPTCAPGHDARGLRYRGLRDDAVRARNGRGQPGNARPRHGHTQHGDRRAALLDVPPRARRRGHRTVDGPARQRRLGRDRPRCVDNMATTSSKGAIT